MILFDLTRENITPKYVTPVQPSTYYSTFVVKG